MSKAALTQFPHSIGLAPQQSQGVRALGPLTIVFPGVASGLLQSYTDDFNIEEIDGSINSIQSVWIDSTLMSLNSILTIQETGQSISIPPNSQGFVPVFAAGSMTYNITTVGATANMVQILKLTFFNSPCSPGLWKVDAGAPQFVATALNAGNAVLSVQPNGGFAIPVGNQVYVDGFLITGTGATLGGAVTAVLANIYQLPNGASGNLSFAVPVPNLPENLFFQVTFPKPLVCEVTKSGNTITSGGASLVVPAMGAGQLAASAFLFYHLG